VKTNFVYILVTVLALATATLTYDIYDKINNLQEQLEIGCGMEEVTDEVDS